MAISGPDVPPASSRLLHRQWAKFAVALVCLGLLLAGDLLSGPAIRIGGLMVAVPALAAGFLGPGYVLAIVALTLPSVVIASASNNTLDIANFPVSFTTVVIISAFAVAAAAIREKRERELAQARWVTAMTQRALLRPLPRRLGPLVISSMYMAADEESTIGGDVYATARLPGRSRVLIGDVQGKGLAAVEMAGYLLSAFRRAARQHVGLGDLPGYLDVNLREDLTDTDAGHGGATDDEDAHALDASRRRMEGFVTALIMDFDERDDAIHVANRGHPSPLLIHEDKVRALDPDRPGLPLGLGDLDGDVQHVDIYDFAPGDTVLLYTDGVTEARDRSGTFYPLAERLERWTDRSPQALLEAVRSDLLGHVVSARLGDDVAMVAVHRPD